MNKKILSFIFGSLLMFSLFGAIEFQEVAAVGSITVQLTGPGYPTYSPAGYCYFRTGSTAADVNPADDIRLWFRVSASYTPTTELFNAITIIPTTPAAGVVLKAPASHIAGTDYPSGWTVSSSGAGLKFTRTSATSVSSISNVDFYIRIEEFTGGNVPDGTSITWTVSTDNLSGGAAVASTVATSTRDDTPPTLYMKYIGITAPKIEYDTATDLIGKGTISVNMYASELLYKTPTASVNQQGSTATTVTMYNKTGILPSASWGGSGTSSNYTIKQTSYDGVANVIASAFDLAGNQADSSNIAAALLANNSDGATFIVDTTCNAPSLQSPDNGAYSQTGTPLSLRWSPIGDQAFEYVTYTIQWAKNTSFSTELSTKSAQINEDPVDANKEWITGTGIPPWSPDDTALQAGDDWRGYNVSSLNEGIWFWRVKATDSLGNESVWASYRSIQITGTDITPPSFRVRYIKTPKIDYNKSQDVIGSGTLQIKIYCSELLKAKPTVQVKLHNQTTWSTLSVTPSGSDSVYTATYSVPPSNYNNGLALISISGEDLSGNVGTTIADPKWDSAHPADKEKDSDGATFYVDTACDAPSLYRPSNGYVIPGNSNEANFTFYKISDISAERKADPLENNCITYHVQYSTTSGFTSNVITESIDVNESFDDGNASKFCYVTVDPYNKWYIKGGPSVTTWPDKEFPNLRMHKSQSLSNGTWYWRTFATDRLGNQSPFSETRSFVVSTVAPNLYSPADLSLILISNPELLWHKVASAASYNIRLSRGDTNFLDYTLYPDDIAVNIYTGDTCSASTDLIGYEIATSTPPNPAIGNLEDGEWYWKVASNLDVTSYSETWRFTVDSTGPPAPNLITLTNGQVSQNKRPEFTWQQVTDVNNLSNPVRYYIQISGNSSFPDSNVSGTTMWPSSSSFDLWKETTYQRGPLTVTNFVPAQDFPETLLTNPSHVYYWRVYAVDSAGNAGSNSYSRNFRVSTSPPLLWGDFPAGQNEICESPWPTGCLPGEDVNRDQIALALRSPSNGFTLNSSNPQLEWRHSRCDCVVKEISSYIIQYSTDITFPPEKTTDVSGVFQVLGINTDNNLFVNMGYTIQTPLYNGTYFWRVCAVDTAGNRTQFTAPWSFTVNVPNNEQPASQCSSTVPCPSGFTCQNGTCVAVSYSAGNLTLTVQNSAGTAIAGATVTVDGVAQVTDAAGQVTYTALSGGNHTLNNVTASGYVDYGTSTILVNGNTTQALTMTVPGTEGYIWGTVYFDAIGTAAPNVLIDIYNQSTDVKVDSRLTNSEGKFQSSPLPSTGTYYAKIPAYEKELRDLQPTSLTTGEKIVILETKGTVTGIVQDDTGQIVSSATVVLKKYPGEEFVDTKTTNTIGQFSFDALPGTYVVTISKAGYDAYTSSSFSVQSKQTVNLQSVLGSIVLNSIRGTLTVSVKDDKGATINTATVTIRSSTGAVVKSITTSGGTGSTQLAPGAYRVSAVSSGFAESLQQSTNITSNQTSSVSITLAPATGSIRVVAKDASGAPLAGASVYVDGTLSGITDSEGELLVTGLKLGTHTVRITKGGFTTVEEQVTAGDSTVIVDTALRKNNLPLYLGIGLGLLILAGALYYFKFGKQQGPKRPPMSKGLTLPSRPGAPKLRPHRHKGGLPPSSIRVKKKNL